MAKTDGRYIQFYTAGSAAADLAPALRVESAPVKRTSKSRKLVLYIDPIAILGMVTAVILTICVLVANAQLSQAKADYEYVYNYNCQLKQQHKDLEKRYASSYNKEDVRMEAVLMGYVPSSQLQRVTIRAAKPEPIPEEPGFIEQTWNYLVELFA